MKINDRTPHPPATVAPNATPPQWEFRSCKAEAGAPLDQFGHEGWELVAVVPCLVDPAMVIAYFKRRRA